MYARGFAIRSSLPLEQSSWKAIDYICPICQKPRLSTSAFRGKQDEPFRTRLRTAWRNTRVEKFRPIPVGLGIAFLGAVQFYRVNEREKRRRQEEQDALDEEEQRHGRPKKRKRIRPSGPWYRRMSNNLVILR